MLPKIRTTCLTIASALALSGCLSPENPVATGRSHSGAAEFTDGSTGDRWVTLNGEWQQCIAPSGTGSADVGSRRPDIDPCGNAARILIEREERRQLKAQNDANNNDDDDDGGSSGAVSDG